MNGIQLEMNFEGPRGNRFREKLNNGIFQVLVEVAPPPASLPLEDAVARFADIEYAVSAYSNLSAALAFPDHSSEPEHAMDTVRFASAVCKMDRDKHLLCISGRSRSLEDIEGICGHAAAEGFRNILPVTGMSIPGESAKDARSRHYTESVHMLHAVCEHYSDILTAGCSVNPFCYVPETSFPQYFKLMKKLNQGASFIVTQFGWDMRKLQELRWFLSTRSTHTPSISRFLLLNPEKAKEVISNQIPGLHISPDLNAMLRQELTASSAQFEAAQWRRLQIHAAGIKFLGYSGIQIAGADSAAKINTLLNYISDSFKEFATFDDWLAAYQEYYQRLELAPYPYRFYQFDDLLSVAQPPEQPVFSQSDIAMPTDWEQCKYKIASKLFAHADTCSADEKRITKKILVSCKSCNECRLPKMNFICPENCPRGMANGPCGSVGVDGICEFGGHLCIHAQRMRLINWLNDYSSMEEICIPPVEP